MIPEFEGFGKIARLSKPIVITEKIDGTNAQILITPDGDVVAGSRNRYLDIHNDNYGFANWVENNKLVLKNYLGVGRHFGEWYGKGILRSYGMQERKFALFNTSRWKFDDMPDELKNIGVTVVPVLYEGELDTQEVNRVLSNLASRGSVAVPGYDNPEGIMVYHSAANVMFKKYIENDKIHKGQQ